MRIAIAAIAQHATDEEVIRSTPAIHLAACNRARKGWTDADIRHCLAA